MFKKALKIAIPGVGFAIVMSGILGYFVFPIPTDQMSNAISNAIGGAVNAFLASMFGLMTYMKQEKK